MDKLGTAYELEQKLLRRKEIIEKYLAGYKAPEKKPEREERSGKRSRKGEGRGEGFDPNNTSPEIMGSYIKRFLQNPEIKKEYEKKIKEDPDFANDNQKKIQFFMGMLQKMRENNTNTNR
jgi:hypothetical protein